MPRRAWSDKRERQYEHIKEGLLEQGRSEDKAEEIAARTVNKEAKDRGIDGRSKMSKAQLERALARRG
jgi:plasmid stabilization system protein ParE